MQNAFLRLNAAGAGRRFLTSLSAALDSPSPAVAGALAAPGAMLAGALGLAAVWALQPHGLSAPPPHPSLPAAPAGAAPAQNRGVEAAALRSSEALDRMLVDLGSPITLGQPTLPVPGDRPTEVVAGLRAAEVGRVQAAAQEAQERRGAAEAVFRSTGLDPRAYGQAYTPKDAGVSPLELRDAHVLAARLDVDLGLARQLQATARDLLAAQSVQAAAGALPLATPVDDPVLSSPFGSRVDPFTHAVSFHPGQDFSGRYGQAVHATAPGVVSFVGQRTGYGNCVEVDHGYGFKTRYGHLSGFVVGVGTPVRAGEDIGRMGSTGRSTGVHLHYEVWASGRLMNPAPFLKAGAPHLRG